ncbi:MAG: PocR ligand-binding domain-containing protein [Magnetococcales bacterium]|nr:PocR ligand-binding domain-containing protein [Magnetococcales bacterium]
MTLSFADLINLDKVQSLIESSNKITGAPIGILDLDGNILVGAGWQRLCMQFHRVHPETCSRCQQSDHYILERVHAAPDKGYVANHCGNGLWDVGIPIVVSDTHVATCFLGQFFYEDEQPDQAFFVEQAEQFGFDEQDYLAALDKVPVFSRNKVGELIEYIKELVTLISFISLQSYQVEQEITARLKKQNLFSKTIIQSLPGLFYLFDQDMKLIQWNENFAKAAGYPVQELYGKHPLVFIAPSEHEHITVKIQEVFAKGYAAIESVFLTKEGQEVPFYFTGVRFDVDGKSHLMGSGVDIAERIRAEQALKQSEARLKAIIDNTPAVVFLKDLEGRFMLVNPRWESMVGFTEQEVIGKTVFEIFPDSYAQKLHENDQKVVRSGVLHQFEDEIFANGMVRAFISSKFIITDEHGQPYALCGMAEDITERKKLEEENERALMRAEAANRAKSTFLATMSHEIRTPLNAILGMGELLLETELTETQTWCANTLSRSGKTLLSLINDILDLSKIEAGQFTLENTTLNLHKLIAEIVGLFELTVLDKGLILDLKIERSVPHHVNGDPIRIRQVLMNLIGNGVKFTVKGSVNVHVTQGEGERIQFTVKDTGPGIPLEKQEEIFQPFTQADSSTTRKYGGTGLGLTICRRIVELMGGTIALESKLDQGSAFSFSVPLPAVRSNKETVLYSVSNVEHVDLLEEPIEENISKLRILLVDDAEDNRLLIQAFLKKMPHHIVMAVNGAEAVARFKEDVFDLILMDIQMPIMDGYEATRRIRLWEQETHRDPTTIIALTAHAMVEESQQIMASGCNVHLTKPIGKKRLIKAINKISRR